MKKIVLILSGLLFVGCASKPVLYPNAHYKSVGEQRAKSDVDQCMQESEVYLKNSKSKQVAKGAGSGAVFGAIVGAVSGSLTGNLGRGAARGAAAGAVGGAAGAAASPDVMKRRFVNQCLAEKNYRVIGWD